MILGAYKINNIPVSQLDAFEIGSLNGNPAFIIATSLPSGYQDITSIENLDIYGNSLIGTAIGFKDWKCLQREIKTLVFDIVDDDINTNWNNLNANEKLIACNYILSRIPPAKFGATVTNAAERMRIATEYDFNNRSARGSWTSPTGRIQAMRIFLFSKIGTQNSLEVLYDVVRDGLIELYEGGIEGTVEDGNIGLFDFILSRAGYSSDGLTTRDYPVIDGSGDSLEDVADALIEIAANGMY
jgi:hypothetical protein